MLRTQQQTHQTQDSWESHSVWRTYAPHEVVLRLEEVAQGGGLSYCQCLPMRWRTRKMEKKDRREGREIKWTSIGQTAQGVVQHFTVISELHCTALYCSTQKDTEQRICRCTITHCTAYYTTEHRAALHTTLYCILHYRAPHCTA